MTAVTIALTEAMYLGVMGDQWIGARYPQFVGRLQRLAIPFFEYRAALQVQGGRLVRGFEKPQYLLGSFSATGWWYYYPVAFLLKTTCAALLLILLALAVSARGVSKRSITGLRFDLAALSLFVLMFLGAAMSSKLDFGLRFILPIYPIIYLLVTVLLTETIKSNPVGNERRVLAAAVIAVVVWHAGECIATRPNYIGYFNELIGSKDNASFYLIDSNLDWGQDLKRLAQWIDRNHVPEIRIDYFGGGDPAYYLGAKAILWQETSGRPLPPGLFALSKHFYRVSPFFVGQNHDYERMLRNARRVATINGSIDVYFVGSERR